MRKAFVAIVTVALLASPAFGHKRDLIRAGKRLGPIKLYETTVREVKRWFGEPTSRKVDERGCVRNVVQLRWPGLKVFAGRYNDGRAPVAEAHVSAPVITSLHHGELAIESYAVEPSSTRIFFMAWCLPVCVKDVGGRPGETAWSGADAECLPGETPSESPAERRRRRRPSLLRNARAG